MIAKGQRSMRSIQLDNKALSRLHFCFSVDGSQRSIVLSEKVSTATAVHSRYACYIMIITVISPMNAVRLEAVSLDISQVAARIIRSLKSNSSASKVSTRNAAFGPSKRITRLLHLVCLVSIARIPLHESAVLCTSKLSAMALRIVQSTSAASMVVRISCPVETSRVCTKPTCT